MSPNLRRRGLTALCMSGAVCVLAFSTLAQQPAKPKTMDRPEPAELSRAKEIATLIDQGQLNLSLATELAEKHAKGTAVEAKCDVRAAQPGGQDRDPTTKPSTEKSIVGKSLVYEVSCFAGGKLQTIHVDGLTKKVIERP